ncbi:MAG: acetylglutamate kinase [Desulfovibrionaceae bacterium]|nr:acetylglutamate kinase [Desulfovibrionaceae bacterium]
MPKGSRVANILLDALPYIREFHGRTVVIKYGGHAMKDETLKAAFAKNVVLLKYIGLNPVIVHGGGPQIGEMLKRLAIDCTFREGLRVTDGPVMDVVEMVLVGRVNKEIVNLLNQHGGRAVGISGKDGRTILARKLEMYVNGDDEDAPGPRNVDLGQVGEVMRVDTSLIRGLEEDGFIPVIAPVGVDEDGNTYNINADSVAGAVASALKASRLMLLTDVPGVLGADGELISSLTRWQAVQCLTDGTAKGGMIPKLKCCLEALEDGVEKAFILDGRVPHVVLLELFTPTGVGTELVPDPPRS